MEAASERGRAGRCSSKQTGNQQRSFVQGSSRQEQNSNSPDTTIHTVKPSVVTKTRRDTEKLT